jgi:hypothetical protein
MTMKKNNRVFCALAAPLIALGCAAHMATYVGDPQNQLLDRTKTALCIPVDSLHVTYTDNTKAVPDSQISDSFLTAAARSFFSFEISRCFHVVNCRKDSSDSASDSLQAFSAGHYSHLLGDTGAFALIGGRVRDLALKYKADFVIIPYSCTVRQISTRPEGWRNTQQAPAYERPVDYHAKTSFHVQIWDKSGRLVFERIGRDESGKPLFYSLFKKDKVPGKDLVEYAKRYYALPLVKSLYKSVRLALMVQAGRKG